MPENKPVALITGASSGIGRELARVFARNGYNLILTARNEPALQDLASELKSQYLTSSTVIAADLADPRTPDELFERVHALSIPVDVLVNNAGFGVWGKFTETDRTAEIQLMQLNMISLTQLTKLFAREMVARGRGKILNVASTAAFQPGPLMAVYYASKAYVVSLSNALAMELKGTGVTVTTLCPGPTATPFHKRANLKNVPLVTRVFMRDAKTAAERGYEGLMRGKLIVIPGVLNKIMLQIQRLVPRIIPLLVVRFLQQRRQR